MKIILIFILLTSQFLAQTVYEIPFASKGNEIELSIYNDSENNLSNVQISAKDFPSWINLKNIETEISLLNSKSEGIVSFKFDIDNEATVMEEKELKFEITGNDQNWSKEIRIVILPPEKFELNQNYPNPFNPTTTLSYTIPANNTLETSEVLLFIYDILGRQVTKLVDDFQRPGYYKVEWNASNLASGMYIYQLSMKNGNKTELLRKKMMLMK
ncbi:MAG: T9SS type A sorting domain-containing protein [Ignavibacteriae bacterium]|nr:T9SS type A sorting domain-containing protein [Ignavibacteriota bacterium]